MMIRRTAGTWRADVRGIYFMSGMPGRGDRMLDWFVDMLTRDLRYTGGKWSTEARGLYFQAGGAGDQWVAHELRGNVLLAVNELQSPRERDVLQKLLEADTRVLLDSGVFATAMAHADRHDLAFDVARQLPPDRLDGYAELLANYRVIARDYGDRAWGYIEPDFGGPDQKRALRRQLESEGFCPIPVYHPLNDGWDYFDELASGYDRICCANFAQVNRYMRLRFVATICERKARYYPHLFVHHLGMTPNEWQMAYPIDSADSSSWLSGARFGSQCERAGMKTCGSLGRAFIYEPGSSEHYNKAKQLGAYLAILHNRGMNDHHAAMRRAGLESMPWTRDDPGAAVDLPPLRRLGGDTPGVRP